MKTEITEKSTTAKNLTFRWKYVMLPVVIFFVSLALIAYFYHLLPAEVAYRFNLDGSPKSWLNREMIILLLLIPQLLLSLTGVAIIWGMIKLGRQASQTENVSIKSEGIILLMGNMVALPQIIFGFVMADILSYNVYGIHLMPIWLFALIAMVVGGIIMAIFFIKAIRQAQALAGSSTKKSKE